MPRQRITFRWARAYASRGVLVEYLADLFDVDADDLGKAVGA